MTRAKKYVSEQLCCSKCNSNQTWVDSNGRTYWKKIQALTYCVRCYSKLRYEGNKEQQKQYIKNYEMRNPHKIQRIRENNKIKQKEWYEKNYPSVKDEYRSKARINHKLLRLSILNHYSNGDMRCSCCAENNLLFLTLDHINNDGATHRKSLGRCAPNKLYVWIKNHGYPPMFQVLCMNCNWGKARNGGVCPHKKEVKIELHR